MSEEFILKIKAEDIVREAVVSCRGLADKLSRMNHVILQVCVPRIPVGGTDYCNTGENI